MIVIAADTHDDTVISSQSIAPLLLHGIPEHDILRGIIVVTIGLHMTDTLFNSCLDLHKLAAVTEDGCQLTGQWMECRVESKTTRIVTVDTIVTITGQEEKG